MFTGYSPETVDFLWGIRLNNNREWFLEHKNEYVKYLYEPTKAMGKELFEPFLEKSGELLKVSRIYRDARMHHDLPYKETLWVCIRQETDMWTDAPCLYFEIGPDGVDYGFFFYRPRPVMMKEFRKRIAANPTPFLELIRQTEESTGMTIYAEEYKRPEACENPELERFFRWKGKIGCTIHEDFSDDVFGPQLAERVRDFFVKLIPVYDFFNLYKA